MSKGLPLTRATVVSACHRTGTNSAAEEYDNEDYDQLLLKCETSLLPSPSLSFDSNSNMEEMNPSMASFTIRLQTGILYRDQLETGGDQWYAGLALANHLLHHPELVRGKRCIEVGAGLGLVGLIAAALGASRVVSTDLPCQLEVLRKNVILNQHIWKHNRDSSCDSKSGTINNNNPGNDPETSGFDKDGCYIIASHCFGDVASATSLIALYGEFDVVLGSDVGYDVSLLEPLALSVHTLLSHQKRSNSTKNMISESGIMASSSLISTAAPIVPVALLAEEVRWKDVYNWYKEALLNTSVMSVDTSTSSCECDCCSGSCACEDSGCVCVCVYTQQQHQVYEQLSSQDRQHSQMSIVETNIAFNAANDPSSSSSSSSSSSLVSVDNDHITQFKNTCLLSLYKHQHLATTATTIGISGNYDDSMNESPRMLMMHLSSSSPLRLLTLAKSVLLPPQSL